MYHPSELPLPFQDMSPSLQETISHQAKTVKLNKDEVPFISDELMKYIYVVKKGKVKNYQLNLTSGKEQTLYIYRQNHIFDTAILLDGCEHDVCYQVLEDTELFLFPIEFVRHLLYNHPEFSQKFFLYISTQLRYLEETLTDISLYTTSERLIKLIVQDFQKENIFKFNILKGLSHTETANLLGTARHVVERHLKELKKEKLISIANKKIKMLNAEKLLEKIQHISLLQLR